MWIWTIKASIISVVFIFLIHNIYGFFKNTLTVPKIKDLVNSPTQQYEHIFQTLNRNPGTQPTNTYSMLPTDNANDTLNPYTQSAPQPKTGANMKNELKQFLKKQLNTENNANPPANDYQATNAFPSANAFPAANAFPEMIDISNQSFSSFSAIS